MSRAGPAELEEAKAGRAKARDGRREDEGDAKDAETAEEELKGAPRASLRALAGVTGETSDLVTGVLGEGTRVDKEDADSTLAEIDRCGRDADLEMCSHSPTKELGFAGLKSKAKSSIPVGWKVYSLPCE